jgi:predicted MFS family arabinose efflux permease
MSDIKLERKIVWLAALIQLANVLDFMIVLPLGPDLTKAINIQSSNMGLVTGIYTFSAAFSAIIVARYLDRYDRKKAVVFFLIGLVISTCLAAFAWNTFTILAARTLAGMFGGPVTALSLSMVVDMVPLERRGRAMAIVGSAFTVASVFGIPLALWIAYYFNWQMPFFVIAGFGALVTIGVIKLLPSMKGHIVDKNDKNRLTVSVLSMFKRREMILSFLMISMTSFAAFIIISATIIYFTFNLGYPREELGTLYFVGGIISFAAMMLSGRIVDLYGARLLSLITAIFYALVIADGFLHIPYMSVLFVFVLFMMCSAVMSVITSTIASEAPMSHERAAFMSLQTTFRHLAAGFGGLLSSIILTSDADGFLYNVDYVAMITIICILTLPFLIVILRKELNKRQQLSFP